VPVEEVVKLKEKRLAGINVDGLAQRHAGEERLQSSVSMEEAPSPKSGP